jgi:tetratricopeptide (TPR) repeat protein
VLGITSARLRSYLRGGLVSATRNENGQLRLTFQDLVFLRKAEGLVSQRIPARRVRGALRALAEREIKLTELRLCGDGQTVVVHDGNTRWDAFSGQALLDFENRDAPSQEAAVIPLTSAKPLATDPTPVPTLTTKDLYDRACALESSAPDEARAAYRRVLEREPEFADAHVNLGRLLHECGDVYAALVHYRAALSIRPSDATAAFNAGVALEDLGANADAITAYRRAIDCDPRNPDAHYNLARLLEQSGKPDLAVRHLLLYRQLMKKR